MGGLGLWLALDKGLAQMHDTHLDFHTVDLVAAASAGDDTEVARMIALHGVDVQNTDAVRGALMAGHKKCADLLLPFFAPRVTFDWLVEKSRHYGNQVAHPDSAQINCHFLLERAARFGDTDVFALVLPLVDAQIVENVDNFVMRTAAYEGNAECVRLLIPFSDATMYASSALFEAARGGHAQCVALLLPVSEPKAHDSRALGEAACNGHTECVQLLLPVSDAGAKNSFALRMAAAHGHTDVVRLLLPHSDPHALRNYALRMAVEFQQWDCVDVLWDSSDITQAAIELEQQLHNKPNIWARFVAMRAYKEQQMLAMQVSATSGAPCAVRKM